MIASISTGMPTGSEPIPRGLERIKPSLEISPLRRIDNAITVTGQREQKELAAFHLDRGQRFFEQGNNSDAVTELSRAIYLAPYEARAHLLLGRIYLRTGQTPAAIDAFKIALWSQESAEGQGMWLKWSSSASGRCARTYCAAR